MTVTVNTGIVERDDVSPMTIDQLATWAGLPTRTLREYRTMGLLPPPVRHGRIGLYGAIHRRRLTAVERLTQRGYSLAGVKDLLEAWERGGSLAGVIAAVPGEAGVWDEMPRSYSGEGLAALIGDGGDAIIEQLTRAGVVRRRGDRWIVCSPALLGVVLEARRAGLAGAGVALARQVGRSARLVARQVVELLAAVEPEDELTDLARRCRPLIAQAMATAVINEIGTVVSGHDDERLRGLAARLRIGAMEHIDQPL